MNLDTAPLATPVIALPVAALPLLKATPIPSTSARINSMISGKTNPNGSE
jgi:hypothetical protein